LDVRPSVVKSIEVAGHTLAMNAVDLETAIVHRAVSVVIGGSGA
jgi:hypothetical protein